MPRIVHLIVEALFCWNIPNDTEKTQSFDSFWPIWKVRKEREAGSSYKNTSFKRQLLVWEMVIMVASVPTISELSNWEFLLIRMVNCGLAFLTSIQETYVMLICQLLWQRKKNVLVGVLCFGHWPTCGKGNLQNSKQTSYNESEKIQIWRT